MAESPFVDIDDLSISERSIEKVGTTHPQSDFWNPETDVEPTSGPKIATPCTNTLCNCPSCTCGDACTCGVSLEVVCDPCLDFQDKLTISAKRAGIGEPSHDDTPAEPLTQEHVQTHRNPDDEHEQAGGGGAGGSGGGGGGGGVLEPPSQQLYGRPGAAVIQRSPVKKSAGTFMFTSAATAAHTEQANHSQHAYNEHEQSRPDQPSLREIFRGTMYNGDDEGGTEEEKRHDSERHDGSGRGMTSMAGAAAEERRRTMQHPANGHVEYGGAESSGSEHTGGSSGISVGSSSTSAAAAEDGEEGSMYGVGVGMALDWSEDEEQEKSYSTLPPPPPPREKGDKKRGVLDLVRVCRNPCRPTKPAAGAIGNGTAGPTPSAANGKRGSKPLKKPLRSGGGGGG
eukprot:CAMPEP_0119473562 /NCGR_PEP_ID=MMETSP1344-20130328/5173_1 /TAXON_ID=236787 /ORGANISM="Florenciella parvula, Strain CCMP2471" /LENGTH=397 /DNA_ID=CAMNT_0007506701 /DNA_START=53 /DNA_END=1242 /DNA_ORIENTATION=-